MQNPEDRVIERAQRDESFRQQLLDDPRAAISDELGVEIPDALQIRVIEEDPQEVVLVLPAAARTREVTEEQLGAVAGGGGTPVLDTESGLACMMSHMGPQSCPRGG
jgi:acyl-coenzyme A thioesterase PaaI-like protein